MEKELMVVLICVSFLGTIFLSLYYYLTGRNKERMALIEAGQDLSKFYKKQKTVSYWLRIGILLSGIGLGLVFIELFQKNWKIYSDLLNTATLFLFGGIAMIAANYIDKPKSEID